MLFSSGFGTLSRCREKKKRASSSPGSPPRTLRWVKVLVLLVEARLSRKVPLLRTEASNVLFSTANQSKSRLSSDSLSVRLPSSSAAPAGMCDTLALDEPRSEIWPMPNRVEWLPPESDCQLTGRKAGGQLTRRYGGSMRKSP